MEYADKLAVRVRNALKRHVKEKGYEAEALLSKKEGEPDTLGINDMGEAPGVEVCFQEPVKIIVGCRDVKLFSMKLGDNPEDVLDFIWLWDEDAPGNREPDEAMTITYLGNDYVVTSSSPVSLGNSLILKECRAKKVR